MVVFSLAMLIYSFVSGDSLCLAPTGGDCSISIGMERIGIVLVVALFSFLIGVELNNEKMKR